MIEKENSTQNSIGGHSVETTPAEANGDNRADISRREVIKLGAVMAVAVSLDPLEATARASSLSTVLTQNSTPHFFTTDEFALVDELTELIIPADEHSPGARAAQVAAYIDFQLGEALDEEPKTKWREGLKVVDQLSQEMYSKPFLQASSEQRIALLTRMSQNEMKPQKPEEHFFKEIKSRTVHAYYTSKIGIKQEMEYKGNTYLKEYVGYDAT